jgi:hypothetical protein
MDAAGIAPVAPIHQVVLIIAFARFTEDTGSEFRSKARDIIAGLAEMFIRWPVLPSPIVHAGSRPFAAVT